MKVSFQSESWYWIFMIPTILFLFVYFLKNFPNKQKNNSRLINEGLNLIIVGWIGSSLGGVFVLIIEHHPIKESLTNLIAFHGKSIHTFSFAILLISIYLFFGLKYKKISFETTDYCSYLLCIGMVFGKIGCFLSGHQGCYGNPTNLPWGIILKMLKMIVLFLAIQHNYILSFSTVFCFFFFFFQTTNLIKQQSSYV